jgi:hypothetical protein
MVAAVTPRQLRRCAKPGRYCARKVSQYCLDFALC